MFFFNYGKIFQKHNSCKMSVTCLEHQFYYNILSLIRFIKTRCKYLYSEAVFSSVLKNTFKRQSFSKFALRVVSSW